MKEASHRGLQELVVEEDVDVLLLQVGGAGNNFQLV